MLIVGAGLVGGFAVGLNLLSSSTPGPSATAAAALATPESTSRLTPAPSGQPPRTTAPPSTPTAAPTATPVALVRATVPLVPVVSFWSNASSISSAKIRGAVVDGDRSDYSDVVVLSGSSTAIAAVMVGGDIGLALDEEDIEGLQQAVAGGALGLLPLPYVTPAVRALAVDGVSLFGNDRAASLDEWPLNVTLDLPPFAWDQASTWTLAAGGDILLDRGVAEQVTLLGKGVDFPWDGGTVSITGHHCCTAFGWPIPETERTGNAGIVRELFSSADLGIANMESPVKDNFTYHTTGLVFTGDPRLLKGLKNAGLDFVSLANNHIGNGGRSGVVDSIDELDAIGIAHAGAGANPAQAAEPAYLDAGGQRLGIVSCAVVGGYVPSRSDWGALRCADQATLDAIANARANADLVIVFPHWGHEYEDNASRGQRRLAELWVEAGAELVIGSHPHWAGAIEEIDGKLVFYSLGNLVFDQTWSEPTMEGLILELTFQADRLVQAYVHPTLIMSAAQPNLLDYSAGGSAVLDRVRKASTNLDY